MGISCKVKCSSGRCRGVKILKFPPTENGVHVLYKNLERYSFHFFCVIINFNIEVRNNGSVVLPLLELQPS